MILIIINKIIVLISRELICLRNIITEKLLFVIILFTMVVHPLDYQSDLIIKGVIYRKTYFFNCLLSSVIED